MGKKVEAKKDPVDSPEIRDMFVTGQHHVDVQLSQHGKDVSRVENDVSFASRAGDRHEMVMDNEDLEIIRFIELLCDPFVMFATDSTVVDVWFRRVDCDHRETRCAKQLGSFSIERFAVAGESLAEDVLEVDVADVPSIVVAGHDYFGVSDLLQPPGGLVVLPLVTGSGEVAGDDHDVRLHLVDLLDGVGEHSLVERRLAAVDVAYLGYPKGDL